MSGITREPAAGVQVPVAGAPCADAAFPAARSAGLRDWRGHGNILIVDDDPLVKQLLARSLENLGLTPHLTGNGGEAVDLVAANPAGFQLILLDLKLPGMKTPEILARIHELRPEMPVAIMSGYQRQFADETLGGHRLCGFLPKPFSRDKLVELLRSVLDAP